MKLGWAWILVFSAAGLLLEALHGFKAGVYLDVGSEPRRLMWTLAHAHGTLLGLVHIAFAVTVPHMSAAGALTMVSRLVSAAGILLPLGFFLGGVVIHGGDPGLAVLLVPVGAVAAIVAAGRVVSLLRADIS